MVQPELLDAVGVVGRREIEHGLPVGAHRELVLFHGSRRHFLLSGE
jgi:hypothetical protein